MPPEYVWDTLARLNVSVVFAGIGNMTIPDKPPGTLGICEPVMVVRDGTPPMTGVIIPLPDVTDAKLFITMSIL